MNCTAATQSKSEHKWSAFPEVKFEECKFEAGSGSVLWTPQYSENGVVFGGSQISLPTSPSADLFGHLSHLGSGIVSRI